MDPAIREISIDLDTPAYDRWFYVAKEFKEEIKAAEAFINSEIDNAGFLAKSAVLAARGLLKAGSGMGLVYYGEEIKGLSHAADVSPSKLALLQFVYESAAACTSIIVPGPNENEGPLLVRTMDWAMEILEPLSVKIRFTRGQQAVCTVMTWAGYVGAFTGMSLHAHWGGAVNFRAISTNFMANVWRSISRGWPVGFLLRECLETASSYDEAVKWLANSSLIAPVYYTVVGSQSSEGCVITRGRKGEDHPRLSLEDEKRPEFLDISGCAGLVQTNADYCSKNPEDDIMESFRRRSLAATTVVPKIQAEWMTENCVCQGVIDTCWEQLKFPIFNSITIYGCVIHPSSDYFEARLPDHSEGCFLEDS